MGSIVFSGSGTDVLVNETDLDVEGNFSWYADLRSDDDAGKQAVLQVGRNTTDNVIVYFWNGEIGVECDGGASGFVADYSADTPIAVGVYHRVTVIRNGTTVSVYLESTLKAQVTHDATGSGASNPPRVGTNQWFENYVGAIGHNAILQRVQSTDEIALQLAQGKPVDETSVFGEFQFVIGAAELDDEGPADNDWTGSGYTTGANLGPPWEATATYQPGLVIGRGKVGIAYVGSSAASSIAVDALLAGMTLAAPAGTVTAGALAQGALVNVSLAAPSGTATAGALAQGALVNITLAAPAGTVSPEPIASGSLPGVTLAAPAGTVTAGALAQGALVDVALAAPAGTITAGALAQGALANLTLSAPAGTAFADPFANASLPGMTLAAPTGTATTGSTEPQASGALPGMSMSAPAGSVLAGVLVEGAMPAGMVLVAPDGEILFIPVALGSIPGPIVFGAPLGTVVLGELPPPPVGPTGEPPPNWWVKQRRQEFAKRGNELRDRTQQFPDRTGSR